VLKIARDQAMFDFKRNKPNERFYLLPGQGGAAYRRKQRVLLKWSVAVGLLLAAILSALIYWLNRPQL
jgi:hypothetical protein